MAFTRNWSDGVPIGAEQASDLDTFIQNVRGDISDRIKSQVYGFIAGENTGYPGFKKQIFKQQSSAPGTPNADEIILYSIDDGSNCGLFAKQEDGYTKQLLKKVGSDINFVIEAADIPADVIDSQHYAANSIDPEHLVDDFTFDTFPLSPSAAPDANYELANKKYVDDLIAAEAFSPDPMTGDNDSNGTVTFPNSLIIKWGDLARAATVTTVTFDTAFSNACFNAVAQGKATVNLKEDCNIGVYDITAASFKIRCSHANQTGYRWFAIGR